MKAWPILRKIAIFYVVVIVAASVIIILNPNESARSTVDMIWLAVAIFAMLPLMSWIGSWLNSVIVTSEGIKVRNHFFVMQEMHWSEIREVRPINLDGYQFISLYSSRRALVIDIPFELHKQDDFELQIRKLAGTKHPLCQWYTEGKSAA